MMLVTIEQASAHLRRDTDADDNDLVLKIEAASGAVLNYLKDGADEFLDTAGQVPLDSNGDPVGVPYEVRAAVLILLGVFYSYREGEAGIINPQFSHGYLPPTVTALLYPLRDPALR